MPSALVWCAGGSLRPASFKMRLADVMQREGHERYVISYDGGQAGPVRRNHWKPHRLQRPGMSTADERRGQQTYPTVDEWTDEQSPTVQQLQWQCHCLQLSRVLTDRYSLASPLNDRLTMASTCGRPQPSPRLGSTKASIAPYSAGSRSCGGGQRWWEASDEAIRTRTGTREARTWRVRHASAPGGHVSRGPARPGAGRLVCSGPRRTCRPRPAPMDGSGGG